MTTNGQLNNTRGYHIKPTNSTCDMISGFRIKGSCSSVLSKITFFVSAVKFKLLSKSVINEKYFDKYGNKKMYAKIRFALGVCVSICVRHHSALRIHMTH